MVRLVPLILLPACFYVTADDRKARFDLDEDGIQRPADCDDDDPKVGRVTWYADTDGDGFGDPGVTEVVCEQPDGFVDNPDDCDDTTDAVQPGATELCNDVDDDCNGIADDGAEVPTWYEDNDGDGQGDANFPIDACDQPLGAVANADDCDDSDPYVLLGGTEVACNTIDDDCDGDIDLDDTDVVLADWTWYFDNDGDNYGVDTTTEVACAPSTGFVADGGDCDDYDPYRYPTAPEVCNGIDDDCDSIYDPYGSIGSTAYYPDLDGDGRGSNYVMVLACVQPYDHVTIQGDCDDSDPCVYVGAQERCNGNDDNCDLTPDDDCVAPDTGTPPGGQCW